MKQRKMRKKDHKVKISLLTGMLILVTLVLLSLAVYTSINNKIMYLKAKEYSVLEASNMVGPKIDEVTKIDCDIVASLTTTSGRSTLQVSVDSSNPKYFLEYRYYIKEATNDMYVLEELSYDSKYAYTELKPGVKYDVKVVGVGYNGKTVMTTTSGVTATID